jgi:2,4-dienoyl-CoA reductase-like NADH-dependent reductase (Old Yellow Enzyme family)
MNTEKSKIFTPFTLKNRTVKNRLGVAPMTRMSSVKDSIPRQDVFDFLIRRARNEAAIVYTEAIVTDYESAQGYPGQARMVTQRQIDSWRPVVQAIEQEGALTIMQMFHCGRMSWNEINPAGRVIAPSAVAPREKNPLTTTPYPVPDEMSQFDIEHVVKGFAETARGAVAAGFKAIEIHGAHGYLVNQFLSSYSNKRTDSFGGSPANRFRFAREVIAAVKKEVPDDIILVFRISNWGIADMDVSLFGSAEEWQEMIRLIAAEPIDAISVSTYDYRETAFGTAKNMAQLTREATELPIMICGKIHDRDSAEEALLHADVALSGKSMLLNPDRVADVRAGKDLPSYTSDQANIAYTKEPLP